MNQRTVIWPYALVLGCLFALALIAPHVWNPEPDSSARQAAIADGPPQTKQPATNGAALVLPAQVQPAGFLAQADSGNSLPNVVGLSENSTDPVVDRWQSEAAAELKDGNDRLQEPVRLAPDDVEVPAPTPAATPSAPTAAGKPTPSPSVEPNLIASAPAPSAATTDASGPIIEVPAPPVLDLHREASAVGETLAAGLTHALRALAAQPKRKAPPAGAASTARAIPIAPAKSAAAIEKPKLPLARPNFGAAIATDSPDGAAPDDVPPTPATPGPVAWPLPRSLLSALQALAHQDNDAVRGWTIEVKGQIEHLNRLQPHEVHQAAVALKELRHEVAQATALAGHAKSMQLASEIRRVQYAMVRRLDVWDIVCDERQTEIASNQQAPQNRRRMELCLANINSLADQNGAATGLRERLMLDTLAELAKRDDEATADQRRHIAREVLARIAERRQAGGRPPLLDDRSLTELDRQLRHWAAEPMQGEELLAVVERYESAGRTKDARRLAELRDELSHSTVATDVELGRRLDMHYRNANVRIALSSQLINRLLPEQKTVESPVNDTILGTPVRGRSTTSSELSVRLLPNPRTWQLALDASGNVDSRTSSTYGPVTFQNQGAAQFCVRKRILIDTAGIHVEPAVAAVENNSTVAGIQTNYDSIPLVRSIVRNYALSQRQHKLGEANQEAEDKIRQTACSRVDSQVEPRLAQVERNFRDQCLAPLKKLGLNPTIATLETTETRLTVRSRLASGDQLAAHTPRPDAPANSLASVQLHESAANNLLDHLDLAGRTFTLPELQRHLNDKLSRTGKPLPQDFPEGVEVTFAKTDPLRIHCLEGRIELVLNIAEIRQGKRRWHDFEVRALYRPETRGLAADFKRDGSIELGGLYKGKTEIALRGIFSKVLSRDRKISLLPKVVADDPRMVNLQVTQLVVVDGWIGLAIGPAASVARQQQPAKRL